MHTSCRVLVYSLCTAGVIALMQERALGQASGVANVTFQWTDRGGTVHVMPSTWVTGVEDDGIFGTEPAGHGFTSLSGVFAFTGSDLTPFDSQTEFRGTVQGFLGSGMTAYAQIQDTTPTVYSQNWPASGTFNVPDPPGTAGFTYTVDNTTYSGSALGVLQAVKFMHDYYVGKGLAFPYLTINYDATTTNGSFYNETTSTLTLHPRNWSSWDVIMHEVGHHVAFHNNLDGNFGGPHNYGSENIVIANPAPGARLAWGEGVATFLNQLAVKDGNLAAAIPGLPAKDYDTNYDEFNTPLNASTQNDTDNVIFQISIENRTPITGAAGQNLGEGDELSVMRVLWDVYDTEADTYQTGFKDAIKFGAAETLALMAGADIFEDFWDNLANASIADKSKVGLGAGAHEREVLGRLGETLQEYNISSAPIHETQKGSRPTLEFLEQNNDRSSVMKFLVLSEDYTTIIDSFTFNDTPGINIWQWQVSVILAPGTYRWAALSNSAIDQGAIPATEPEREWEWYWSSIDTWTVVPEASSILLMSLGSLGMLGLSARRRRPA